MEVKFLYNYGDEELFCTCCKEKIRPFEKFAIVYEEVYNGLVEKLYHATEECLPESDNEEPYIIPEE